MNSPASTSPTPAPRPVDPDDLDLLVEEITVDAYGDEGYWAFLQAIDDEVRFPINAALVGMPVVVARVDFDGDERRGLVAAVVRNGSTATISMLDLDLTAADPTVACLVAAYRHWLGLGERGVREGTTERVVGCVRGFCWWCDRVRAAVP